jgi:hypothetical protein
MKLLNIIKEWKFCSKEIDTPVHCSLPPFSEASFVDIKMQEYHDTEQHAYDAIFTILLKDENGSDIYAIIDAIVNDDFIYCISSYDANDRKIALDSLFWAIIVADQTLYLQEDGKYHPQKFSYYAPHEM